MTITKDISSSWLNFYRSSVGKKIITGVTGLGLTLFVFLHLLGNLLFLSDRKAYNRLAHGIDSLSFLLYGVELILLVAVIFHLVVGISIRLKTQRSRPIGYSKLESAGNPSKQSLSSRSMAITGLIVLFFLVWHLSSFKFGTYYSTTIDGVAMRDLARLISEKFQSPVYTFGYLGCIALLGVHLRHGIWSGLQSLGALDSRNSGFIYSVSFVLAVLVILGFVLLPLCVYYGLID